jgi:hypothetical protein
VPACTEVDMTLIPVRGARAEHVTACPIVLPGAAQPAPASAPAEGALS